jgi:hypothetical protein
MTTSHMPFVGVQIAFNMLLVLLTTGSMMFVQLHNENWRYLLLVVPLVLVVLGNAISMFVVHNAARLIHRRQLLSEVPFIAKSLVYAYTIMLVVVGFAFAVVITSVFTVGFHDSWPAPYTEMIAYFSVRLMLELLALCALSV